MLTLRPYQQAAIASIYGYFEKESGNPLVVIPTAGGKSLVMAAFIDGVLKAWPDQRVLVVTHPHRFRREMGVAGGSLDLRVAEELADHRQTLTRGDGGRRKGVAQVVDADVLHPGASTDALPEGL